MNLLAETIEVLKRHDKTQSDVVWCGNEEFGFFHWEDFVGIANIEYDSGFGSSKVADDLLIVGKDFWLTRHEYDGSESWDFHTYPKKSSVYNKPTALTIGQAEGLGRQVSCGWESLETLNSAKAENEN
jgi:hypothetical protein